MRIGWVVPGGIDRPGGSRVIPSLLGLARRVALRHTLTVVVATTDPRPGRYDRDGFEVVELPTRRGVPGLGLARRVAQAGRALGPKRFDVLHGFWAGHSGTLAATLAPILGAELVMTIGGGEATWLPDLNYGARGRYRGRRLFDFSFGRAAVVTYGSRYVGCELPSHPRKVWLPLGVDADAFSIDSFEVGPRVAIVAHRNAVKDPWTALRALARLRHIEPELEVEWVGSDTLDGEVERRAAALGLADAIDFTGPVAPESMPRVYRDARVLMQSSRFESQGVAVLEAACAGVPTVGTEVGLVHELAPRAAVSVPVGDDAKLAEECARLLKDNARCVQIGEAARAFARAHDLNWTANAFDGIYQSLAR